ALKCGGRKSTGWTLNSGGVMKSVILFCCLALTAAIAAAAEEKFDTDPHWEGYRNRLVPNPPPVAEQNFGYSRTNHAGGKVGEIGGRMQRSVTPAWYAKKIPTKTFDDKLSV